MKSSYYLLLQMIFLLFGFLSQSTKTYIQKKCDLKSNYYFEHLLSDTIQNVPLLDFEVPNFYNNLHRLSTSGYRGIGLIDSILIITKSLITLIGFITILFSYNWVISVVFIFCAIPIYFFNIKISNYKFNKIISNTELSRKTNYFSQLFKDKAVSTELKIFNHGSFLLDKWKSYYQKYYTQELEIQKKTLLYSFIIFISNSIVLFTLSASLILFNSRNKISVGAFVALLQALSSSQNIINDIISQFSSMYENSLYATEFFEFIESYKKEKNEKITPFPRLKKGMFINNISFNYPNSNKKQLKNITFNVNVGEKVVIVGDNGAGKTTLIKCLMGLYPVTQGEILYDEININNINPSTLSDNISVTFQNFSHYNLSLKENIAIGNIKGDFGEERFYFSVQASNIEEFAKKLPDNYDTELGNQFTGGYELSGGQWQKIALARTLFSNPQIIVLDEAFSALDPISENSILEKFTDVTQGKTAIIISHRLSTSKFADKILVMKEGEIIEIGDHKSLMEGNSYYKKMYTSQSKWYK